MTTTEKYLLIMFFVLVVVINLGFIVAWWRIWRIEKGNSEYRAAALGYMFLAAVLVLGSVYMAVVGYCVEIVP